MKIVCTLCKKQIGKNYFIKHIQQQHNNLSQKEKIQIYQNSIVDNSDSKLQFLSLQFINFYIININNSFTQYILDIYKLARLFNPFCKTILEYRNLSANDIKIFFNLYLPYKKSNPKDQNSKKLALIYCNNNQEQSKKFYEYVLKKRNAFTGHTGLLSPWSTQFIGYKDLSDQEKLYQVNMHRISKLRKNYKQFIKNLNTTLEYYLNRGYSLDDAKQKLKQRQTTMSIDKFIKKYGIELGIQKFQEHIKILSDALNALKKRQYSKISQELFFAILNKLNLNKQDIYFAENNGEYIIKNTFCYAKLDFYIPKLNKWIQFDGNYWHNFTKQKEKDIKRTQLIKKSIPNIQLKRINQKEYRKNKEQIINQCILWIMNGK